ncbi:MAG: hypothetical protein MK089_05930 [Phycisphaerales bacterium]|nr:hypothetical protein [Phycisphaerales bacterium]
MPQQLRRTLCAIAFAAPMTVGVGAVCAGQSDGVRNGSFSEAVKDGWLHTQYLSNSFQVIAGIESEPETDRGAFIRMEIDRTTGNEDAFPSEPAMLIQHDIVLGDCSDLANVILQFDYRSTGVTGFYGLLVELKARDGFNEAASISHKLLGTSIGEIVKDPDRGWCTAQLSLPLPAGSDPADFLYDIEFTMLPWGADVQQPVCGVAFPVVDLDEISLAAVDMPGDPLPEPALICGDAWAAMVGVDVTMVPLVTEAVQEPDIEPIFRHRIINPLDPVVCGEASWPETPCLLHLSTTAPFYTPAIEPCQADFNGDGKVDGADLALLLVEWNSTDSFADLNCDSLVDGGDLSLLLSNWGFCNPTAGLIAPPSL